MKMLLAALYGVFGMSMALSHYPAVIPPGNAPPADSFAHRRWGRTARKGRRYASLPSARNRLKNQNQPREHARERERERHAAREARADLAAMATCRLCADGERYVHNHRAWS